jgi:hypothetical protein
LPDVGAALRRVTWPRVAVMVGLLGLALVLTQVLGRGGTRISSDRAVAIARPKVRGFTPTGHTVRFIRQGIPPRGYWIVSFWTRKPSGGYDRITLVQLDASTGRITTVRGN